MVALLILATLGCLFEIIASFIIKLAISWWYKESSEERTLRQNLYSLKKEMESIPMVDEFPKYARAQRKYIKLEAEAKEKINNKSGSIKKLQILLSLAIKVLNAIYLATLLYLYRYEPVVTLPKGYLIWPFAPVLRWPCGVEDSISLPIFVTLMKLGMRQFR